MARVTLENVEKSYESLKTVHGIDLDIADGEFIVLVGPSGCGKSTTLRMVAGLETVTGGEIRIGDKRVNELMPGERDIAMVFQNYALYPHLTVAENIVFGLRLRKLPKAEIAARLKRTAELLGLGQLLDRKPRQLSGGQRQRVAMGRALIRNPAVFLFDEPLSNLDAKLRMQMRTEIKELHVRVPTTTIYVTHDQVEAMTLADRVVVMNKGRIEQIAPPEELYLKPATRFVAGFIGSPGMNFLPAKVETQGSDALVRLGDGQRLPLPAGRLDRLGLEAGAAILLGVRPEHFGLGADPERPGVTVVAHLIEPLGMETLVHFSLGGEAVVARLLPNPALRTGATLRLAVEMDRVHFFDPETDHVLG